jgi:hypothetical protein
LQLSHVETVLEVRDRFDIALKKMASTTRVEDAKGHSLLSPMIQKEKGSRIVTWLPIVLLREIASRLRNWLGFD